MKVTNKGRTTPRQKCNHCEEDFVGLISRLKEHLLKCTKLPKSIKVSLNIQGPGPMSVEKSDVDNILAKFFYSAEAVQHYVKNLHPFYISPNRRNLANNLLDAEYQVE
ncbi:44920_t:CDS:2 [Gigaspora margarita]|uniref:44920_t:CDS:1 n=1 Tax=Gigaspora margarita TaxID=4874 RepID=A0ABN7VUT4_GIGMA|nr:44920_t:CDS:2 [Gigaspora margarita]